MKGGPQAFCIDHSKPRSRGGPINDYINLYWVCIPCNMIKHDRWPTSEQLRQGYRFADPCREQDVGIHFVESDDGLLQPLTTCGEYHDKNIRLWQIVRQCATDDFTRCRKISAATIETRPLIS